MLSYVIAHFLYVIAQDSYVITHPPHISSFLRSRRPVEALWAGNPRWCKAGPFLALLDRFLSLLKHGFNRPWDPSGART